MSADNSEEIADRVRRRKLGTHAIKYEVIIESDETHTYEAMPNQLLEDVATEMALDFNSNNGFGKGAIPPGYIFRMRVVSKDDAGYVKGRYSPLDRFLFDGEKVKSLFPGAPETSTVGAFANLYAGIVLLQIAGYGQLERRNTQLNLSSIPDEGIAELFSGD